MVWPIIRGKSYVGEAFKSMKAVGTAGRSKGWLALYPHYTHLALRWALECNRLWLLKNSIFSKTAEIWGIENV
jgi:hypothetical protein